MATTLPGPELVPRSPDANWNRERWERLPEDGNRYEVIDGVLYMTTAPSTVHQWIIRQVFLALFQQIDSAGAGITLWSPIGLFMHGCQPVQPDLLVVRTEEAGIIGERRIEGVPALLVEVLSPSNPDQDLVIKRAAYARAGVPEYWIMRPTELDILVHSQPEPATGQYTQISRVAPDGLLVSPTLPCRAPVAGFFAGAPGAAS